MLPTWFGIFELQMLLSAQNQNPLCAKSIIIMLLAHKGFWFNMNYVQNVLLYFVIGCRPEDGVRDMIVISNIDEHGINKNLRTRYSADLIYVSFYNMDGIAENMFVLLCFYIRKVSILGWGIPFFRSKCLFLWMSGDQLLLFE